ncbi:embryo-specific protein [Coccidioides immitis RMSCC 3703]|uniref:Embryo-specific protein n=2 Tax=Coccidioides immitis TaxID=5501 RepID=A0A0J8RC53_COCIT|nr:embryo-specific protein [Coccidioides immitis RMSCC 2394]KMU82010.1 embryo-specific protein [Coccidioides immitis RMSCC 3703]
MSQAGAKEVPGEPMTLENKALTTGASMIQNFKPVNQICAHLHAYHVYADDPTRCVEANHYCSHVNADFRQCLIYDSPEKNARLIGVEYMITPKIYESLPKEERELWHSHEFEVKSGMLVMSAPKGTPAAVWDKAELAEMENVVPLYGKTYHMWQVDRGDAVPMGAPQLMGSFTSEEAVKKACPGGIQQLADSTKDRFGIDIYKKREERKGVRPGWKIHPDADAFWKNIVSHNANALAS